MAANKPIGEHRAGRSRAVPDLDARRARRAVQPEVIRPPADDAQGVLRLAGRNAGACPVDPAAPLIHEHPTTPLPEMLYDEHINALLTRHARPAVGAPSRMPGPICWSSLILQTGIKKSECMEIKLEHIDLSNPQAPVLYVRYADPRRTLKERKLALGPSFHAGLPPVPARVQAQGVPLRVHAAQSGVCAGGSGQRWRGSRGACRSSSCAGRARCATIATGCRPTSCARSSACPTSVGARRCRRSRSWRARRCRSLLAGSRVIGSMNRVEGPVLLVGRQVAAAPAADRVELVAQAASPRLRHWPTTGVSMRDQAPVLTSYCSLKAIECCQPPPTT